MSKQTNIQSSLWPLFLNVMYFNIVIFSFLCHNFVREAGDNGISWVYNKKIGSWLCFLGHPTKDAPVLKRNVGCAQGRQKRKRRAIITHCKSTKWRRLLLCSVLLPKSSDKVLRWALFMEQNL